MQSKLFQVQNGIGHQGEPIRRRDDPSERDYSRILGDLLRTVKPGTTGMIS